MRLGIRNTKFKLFRCTKLHDDLDPVDVVNELLEKMNMHDPTGTAEPPMQTVQG